MTFESKYCKLMVYSFLINKRKLTEAITNSECSTYREKLAGNFAVIRYKHFLKLL